MEDLISALVNIDEGKVLEIVNDRLLKGDPKNIIEDLRIGMEKIGEKFSRGEYFLSELIMAGETFRMAMQKIEPFLKGEAASLGKVMIGTVEGDIHDLGKNIVVSLLRCAGFTVCDLGVDVSKEKFIEEVKELNPDILAMSGVLTFTRPTMKKVVKALEEAGVRERVKVMIGGPFVDEEWREDIGADAYSRDAYEGVEIAKRFVGVK